MQTEEIRQMSDEDIRALITEKEESRFRLRFRGATETLDKPLELRWLRKDIARLKTILNERARAQGGV
ncbi:MAG TPA: 50S ribosomal protein L29 [Polyangiaceae bacterium]|jgi:large subunit ribosomal protein L29|nr:50S ribosomal protein L29 [Polyangiaceae bacterium]